jgi:hypothetical protein
MNHQNVNLEKFLYRILVGYYYINLKNSKYKIKYPSIETKYEAEMVYENIIEENKFDKRLLTIKEIELYLLSNNIWLPEYDQKIKNTENQIEDTKVEIYLNFLNPSKKKFFKNSLLTLKKILSQLYDKKNSFNHLSIEEYALSTKNEFIISKSIYNLNNDLVFSYNDNLDYMFLQNFIHEIYSNMLTADIIRQIAKSNIWKSYASTSKIERDILDINDDYKLLISFNNMYTNIKQHPECPSEDIISDDDALDGWNIHQNRIAEKEKKKKSIMDKVGPGKAKNKGDHVFIFTNNEEEVSAINDLNSIENQRFKKEVSEFSKNNPGTKWQDLPPIKRQAEIEAQKALEQKIKGK